jgi:hypothetical protein
MIHCKYQVASPTLFTIQQKLAKKHGKTPVYKGINFGLIFQAHRSARSDAQGVVCGGGIWKTFHACVPLRSPEGDHTPFAHLERESDGSSSGSDTKTIRDGFILNGLRDLDYYLQHYTAERGRDTCECCVALHRTTQFLACDDSNKSLHVMIAISAMIAIRANGRRRTTISSEYTGIITISEEIMLPF